MARDHAFHALERFAFPALLYYAPLAVGIRAMPMVVEPAVFVRFLQSQSHADFHLLVQQRRKKLVGLLRTELRHAS